MQGLEVRRGTRVLSADLSFALQGPGLYFLTGPNGSGKSTLLLTLAGLLPPFLGNVWVEGRPLYGQGRYKLKERALHIVYLPQHPECPDELPAIELAVLGRLPYLPFFKPCSKSDYELARQALRRIGFRQPEDRWMGDLSGGERQMVWLAQGLVQNGPLWLLDEPTQHLDPARREHLFNLMQKLAAEHGKTLIVATHELDYLTRMPQASYMDMLDQAAGFVPCTEASIHSTYEAQKKASGLF